ncbi:MAG: hypothetical protein IJN16_07150 [Lachnospiraceae bacterium]|nr:hypothetical protein [Lachnospiraceae bacterium]
MSGIAYGDLYIEGLAKNFFIEAILAGVSTRVGFTTEGKNKWLVVGVDTEENVGKNV